MRSELGSALLLLLSALVESKGTSPPEKPVLLSCRSPDKETFTCWWEPGADGGLPTTHRLYYERERLEGVHECPDYQSAGRNSCFFDQNHTSIWVDYYLTVVASNALGNATSDLFKMDVMDIGELIYYPTFTATILPNMSLPVRPIAPENLKLLVEEREDSPYLHIQWEHPHNTDTKSGWVTVKYELRVKQENDNKWMEYMSGTQTYFRLYSVVPGAVYVVQVRCRLDHGSWSEWTTRTTAKVPDYLQSETPFWVVVSALSAIPLIVAMCILVMKRKYVKQYVLPPVPGPKISGVDFHLLKSGQSEDVVNALIINPNVHTMAWKDQMEEYLIVTEDDCGLLPDPTNFHKNKKSLITPTDFRLELEIQCKEPTPHQSECEKAGERKNEADSFVKKSPSGENSSNTELSHRPPQEQQCPSVNFVNAGTTEWSPSNHEDAVKPFTNSGYVDTRTHVENLREVDVKQVDYSRVGDLNGDSILILGEQNLPLNSSGYTDVQAQEKRMLEDYSRVKEVDSDCKVFLQKENVLRFNARREKGSRYIDCTLQKSHGTGALKVGMCREPDSGYVDNTPELS